MAELVTDIATTNLTPGSAAGRLGDAALVAETALAAGSRDTTVDDAAKVAADAAAKTAEDAAAAKTAADVKAAADKVAADKAAADKVAADKATADKAVARTAAEKAVADAKTPEEKAAAEKALADLKAADDKPGVAPEKYEAFKLPDGLTADAAQVEPFNALAKELNLSQSQAQKLVDFEAGRIQAAAKANTEAYNSLLANRLNEAKADKEIGGEAFVQNVGHAKTFLSKFGTPALQAWLNSTEAGSHVELIRALSKAGKAMGEDAVHLGGSGVKTVTTDLAHRLFPNDK